jgi:hypothetical protein
VGKELRKEILSQGFSGIIISWICAICRLMVIRHHVMANRPQFLNGWRGQNVIDSTSQKDEHTRLACSRLCVH